MVATGPTRTERVSRAEQRRRTRGALIDACRELIARGEDITMPAVAEAAGISEATAYRHFSDLVTLVNESLAGLWPTPAQALGEVAGSLDPVERIGFACEFLLGRVWTYRGAVRALIAATVVRPESASQRPGFRFGLIDAAIDPVADVAEPAARARIVQLKQDLAAIVSAEALFSLTDLCGLEVDAAIASLVRSAQTITRVAVGDLAARGPEPAAG